MATTVLHVRVDETMLKRLDKCADVLGERAGGARITRAEVTRIALERGVRDLESEAPKKR